MSDFYANARNDRSKFLFVFFTVFALIISMVSPYLTITANADINTETSNRFDTIFSGKINLQNAPNVVLTDKQGSVIPSDYDFIMKTTENTQVQLFGNIRGAKTYQTDGKAYPQNNSALVADNVVTAIPLESNPSGAYGAIYSNVGVYKGEPISVRMTVLGFDTWLHGTNTYRPHIYINSKQMGVNVGGADVKMRYEFINAETGKTVKVKGVFSLADVDANQGVEMFNSPSNIKNIYAPSTTNLKYSPTPNGFGIFSDRLNIIDGNIVDVTAENPDHIASMTFDSDTIEFKFYQDKEKIMYNPPFRAIASFEANGRQFKAGDSMGLGDVKAWEATIGANGAAPDQYFKYYDRTLGYTDINIGASYFEVSAYKPLRTEIKPPTKTVTDNDEFEVTENTILKNDEVFTYKVSHFVPSEYGQYVYKSYVFTDDLEDVLSVKDVRVINELGKDVSSYFDIKVDEATSKVTATASASVLNQPQLPISTFYNHNYTFEIDATVKNGADLSKYVKDGTAFIPNKANIAVDGTSYPSNEVVTKYTPLKDAPVITKTVNGKDLYTLYDKKEVFRYGLVAEIPTTVQSDGYAVVDVLEEVLEYKGNPSVVLTKGSATETVTSILTHKDGVVTAKLTTEQLAKFGGGQVEIEFDSAIKEDANLAPYLVEGVTTIPNEAHIAVNNAQFPSNVVNVQVGKVEKLVNGQKHIDLVSKDQIFSYEISSLVPNGAKTFTITDTLENVLKFADVDAITVNMDATVNVEGQKLTVTLQEETIKANSGKPIYVTFLANIKENADLSAYKEQDNKVPNKATVNIDNKPIETNTVTVTPPTLEKAVNGKEHVTLTNQDEVFTYTIDTKVQSGIELFKIQDELENVLEVVETTFTNTTDDETIKDVTPQVEGNLVTVTMHEAETKKYEGKKVRLTIKAKIKEGADLSFYTQGIPNTAAIFADDVQMYTNEVTVELPNISKTVNGVNDYALITQNEIVKYEVKTTLPSTADQYSISDTLVDELEFVGEPTFSIEGIKPSTEGKNVTVKLSDKQIKEHANKDVTLTIFARIVEGADLTAYADKNGKVPNKATLNINGGEIDSNTVTITPPSDKKLVNGKEHVDLANLDETFTYTIETNLPKGKESFVITDTLVKELEVVGTPTTNLKETVINGETIAPPKAVVNGNVVELSFNSNEIADFGGQKVVLTIKAKIKEGADISTYVDNKVPNKATIKIDDKVKETNTVTVTPTAPTKTVNGKQSETLANIEDTFTYEVKTKIPNSAESFVVTDTLVKELEFTNTPTVNVKDAKVVVEGQKVTVTLNQAQVEANKGKDLILTFESGIVKGADISQYLVEGKNGVPNTAYVQIDNNPQVATNEVHVTVPQIEKTINGQKEAVTLGNAKDTFKYDVTVAIPKGAESFTLEDTLEGVIKSVSTETNLRGVEAKVDGQKVAVTLTKEQLAQHGGKELVLTINAQFYEDYKLDKYENGLVPNTATAIINDVAHKSNTVHVTVSDVKLEKTVNGKEDVTLGSATEKFVYEVKGNVPQNVSKYVITDTLVKELDVVKVTSNIEGADIKTDGNKVTVTLGEALAKANANKDVVVTIEAKVKEGADLSAYVDEKVPNRAFLNIDDNPQITSNEVTVQIPSIDKFVNGKKEPVTLEKADDKFTYEVKHTIADNVEGIKSITIADTLEDVLEIDSVKTNIEGLEAKVDGNTVKAVMNEIQIQDNKGKEVIVTIVAKVKKDADLTEYEGFKVPNKATLQINDNPTIDSNIVTVTPPPNETAEPKIVKAVNGQTDVVLEKVTDTFTYTLTSTLGANAKDVVVTDTLDKGVKFVDAKANVDGAKIAIDGQKLTITLAEEQVKALNGKDFVVNVNAKLVDGINLADYKDGKVPNVAQLKVNDKDPIDSNIVTVTITPPTESVEPKIVKAVNGETDVVLEKVTDKFTYTLTSTIDATSKEVVVTDTLDKGVKFLDATTNVDGAKIAVDGQKLTITLTEEQVKALNGQNLVVTVNAELVEGIKLADYKDGKVPNVAQLKVDEKDPIDSNIVTVTVAEVCGCEPTPTKDDITKTVNGKEAITIASKEETFTYEVKVKVPTEATSFIVADELEEVLEFVGEGKVNIEGLKAQIDGQRIVVALKEEDIKAHSGKELVLTFDAKVKKDADLKEYATSATDAKNEEKDEDVKVVDGVLYKVPNVALYQIDDNKPVPSNVVIVCVGEEGTTPTTPTTPPTTTPPTTPNEPTPNNPTTTTPNNPTTNTPNNPTTNTPNTDTPPKLPQTGDSGMNMFVLWVGFGLMLVASLLGTVLFRRYRSLV